MQSAIVSMKDILAAGGRLDPAYHIAIAKLREQTFDGKPLLDHLRATFTEDQARDWVKALPAAAVAPLVTPFANGSWASHRSAAALVDEMAQRMPFETMAVAVANLDAIKADVAARAAQAQSLATQVNDLAEQLHPTPVPEASVKRTSRRAP